MAEFAHANVSPDLLGRTPSLSYWGSMDFDQLLSGFFGTADIASLVPGQVSDGVERLRVQFGLERDGGRRFALWCLM